MGLAEFIYILVRGVSTTNWLCSKLMDLSDTSRPSESINSLVSLWNGGSGEVAFSAPRG